MVDITKIGADGSFPGLEVIKQTAPGRWSLDVEVSGLLRAAHAADAFRTANNSFRYRMEADYIANKIEELQVVAQAIRAEQQQGEG